MSTNKLRRIITFDKLQPELQSRIMVMNPKEIESLIIPVNTPLKKWFYAFLLETEDTVYLVKGNWLKKYLKSGSSDNSEEIQDQTKEEDIPMYDEGEGLNDKDLEDELLD